MGKSKRKNDGNSSDESTSSQKEDVEMIDVSFDFFDPQPIDYLAINRLLSQLFSHDQHALNIPAITNLILAQNLVGSTVKTDGHESDPFSLLTVLNLNLHKDDPAISQLITYLLSKVASNPPFHEALSALLAAPSTDNPNSVGLVISERLVNMPSQLVPPMYRMLEEELQWARDEGEPFNFSHLLFLSRVFVTSQEEMDQDPNANLNDSHPPPSKQTKKKLKAEKDKGEVGIWMYHPEDELIARSAVHQHQFIYTSAPPPKSQDDDESFGVETRGQALLVSWGEFDGIVKGLEGFLGGV